ncbi:type II secretion system F family protein [Halobacillus mangrovi]|uniref:type II secretion system F family protein n=1 Tax=Halobacillus mangrovi TaxID=402384 RepID=UPI003D99AEA4
MHSVLSRILKFQIRREKILSTPQQALFFHRLSHILSKGYPLLNALKMTGWDPALKPIADELSMYLVRGEKIDTAFQKARFSSMITNFLYFGRVHHDLPVIFKQCEQLLQMKRDYQRKLMQVLRYPLLLFVFLLLAFTIIKQTILPNFLSLFQDDQQSLWLMMGVNYLINGLGFIGLVILFISITFPLVIPRLPLETKLKLYQRVFFIQYYHSFHLSYLFTTHLQSLLTAGLTLKEALEVISEHEKYEILSYYCKLILEELGEGTTIGQAMHSCPLLRKELTSLFHHTNDTYTLKDELSMLTSFFIEYFNDKASKTLQLIQPLFFMLIAVIVICIYASIMLPLYQWMGEI